MTDATYPIRPTRRQMLGGALASALVPGCLSASDEPLSAAQITSGVRQFVFPANGIKVQNRAVLYALDDQLLPLRRNLCPYMTKPQVRREPVLGPARDNPTQAPDSMAADLYGTVLRDDGKFRMWYLGGQRGPQKPGDFGVMHLCYAESDDGLRWTKPALNQVEIGGSRRNNAIAIPDPETEGLTLIKDDEDPDPRRRYKIIYQRLHDKRMWTIRTATSPNGTDAWKFGAELPINNFVEFASLYKHDGLYIVNAQTVSPYWRAAGGHNMGRQSVAWVSRDFDRWLPEAVESHLLPEPAAPEAKGVGKHYMQHHLGIGAATSAGNNALVGLYCMWYPGGQGDDWFGYGATYGDFGLVISNNGLHFREPVKGHVFLAAKDSAHSQTKDNDNAPTVLCQGNSILNVGDETRIYHGRWLNLKNKSGWGGEVALATLPRDRWGALGLFPDRTEGSVWTAPVTLPASGCEAVLNATDAGAFQVEIADEKFAMLPGHSGTNAGVVGAPPDDAFDRPVKWKNSLKQLAGRTVRVRILFRKQERNPEPRLYALYLQA